MTIGNEPRAMAPTAIERFLASRYTLGLVLLLALVLRVGHIFSLRSLPLFNNLWLDSKLYDQWAQRIAEGDWLGGDGAFFFDPLYSYVLAIIYKLFGHNLLTVSLLQAVLGCATCALVALIGYRVSGNRVIATLGAFLMAIYRPAIFQEAQIEKTGLGAFLITAALAFAIKRDRRSAFLSGTCLALATLTRGNLLLMLPLGVIYFLVAGDNTACNPASATSRFNSLIDKLRGTGGRNAVAFLLGVVLVLSVPLVRNHHVSGEWVVTTSTLGQNLYTGNNPYNDIGAYKPLPFVRAQSTKEESDFHAAAEARAGRKLNANEVSSFWLNEAVKHMVANPAFALTVFIKKFFLFWSNIEIPDAWDMYFLERYSTVLRLPLLNFSMMLMFAAIGTLRCFRENLGVRLIVGYIAAYGFSVILFFIFARYRIHIIPCLAVLGSLGLHWTYDHVRKQNWQKVLPTMAIAVLVFIFSYAGCLTFDYKARESVNSYTLLAEIYRKSGDFSSAETLLKEALHKFDNDPSTLQSLGLLYATQSDMATAHYYFDLCVKKDETYPDALFYLGLTLESLGKIPEAIYSYRRQLEQVPGHDASRERLARLNQLSDH